MLQYMKNRLFWVIKCFIAFLLLQSAIAKSQTSGTLTFSLTTTSSGGYSPRHLIAIWIESSTGTFIKTKLKQSSNGNLDHLSMWTTKSGQNVVDATTGATLSAHGTRTIVWDGTDASGKQVADGIYYVWVEMAWASSLTSGKTSTYFSFTKGATSVSLTPASTANFSGIKLDWVPKTTGISKIDENQEVLLFPNPTKGVVNFEFGASHPKCNIQVFNTTGGKIFETDVQAGIKNKTIDLSKYSNGYYFINLQMNTRTMNYKVEKIK
jgi:hypothetical protein